MTKFIDCDGNEWGIRLTVGMVKKVRTDAELNLDDILERPASIAELIGKSPERFGQLLWVLCEGEAKARKVDPEAFGNLLDRDTIDRATNALIEELVLFYPRSSAGKAIRERLPEFLAKMDRDIAASVGARLSAELSGTPTGSPGSAGAATPDG